MMLIRVAMVWVVFATLATAAPPASEEAKRLLFYGNSFTLGNNVPASVARLAEAAGHPAPIIVRHLSGGKPMAWHLEQTQLSPEKNIAAEAAAEHGYDAVVLQGFSIEPTRIGDREAFLHNTVALAEAVRGHEAGADALFVLFQTWARGPGHEFYPKHFTEPSEMQQDLVEGYEAARQALAEKFGEKSVVVAPVGEAFASTGFAGDLYAGDIYHAGPTGSLLAAMVLYRTLYGGTITEIDPAALAEARGSDAWAKITDEQWRLAATAADAVEIPRAALEAPAAATAR